MATIIATSTVCARGSQDKGLAGNSSGSGSIGHRGWMPWPVVLILADLLVVGDARFAVAEITAEQVRQSIERGVAFLKRQQRADGSWAEYPSQAGGITSLCTLALLNSGADPDDESVRRALNFLRKLLPERTYAASLQTMVFCLAGKKTDLPLVARNVRWLQEAQITRDRGGKGGWGYDIRGGEPDNSNSQFAVLALYEAERAGVAVSPQTWRLAKAYWEDNQNPDGSWGYKKGVSGTGSMTCAGIACLVITADRVENPDAQVDGEQITCCAKGESDGNRVQRGLKWLGDHFSVTHNPGSPINTWLMYYLYGLERAGRLTARRFIGQHDWYREGADALIKMKGDLADHWMSKVGPIEGDPRIATSFALLFLSKGRWPVLLSKVRHGRGDDWNRHRSDVANLTRYVESRWKKDLVWQVTDIREATVEDLIQSPVLFYCGADSPLPENADQQEELARKIRDYLDRGGFLFAEAQCGGAAFDEGFRKLMRRVFPEAEYRLEILPPEHPIWRAEELVDPAQLRPLLGIEFGCRTSVVYAPPPGAGAKVQASLSCLWELSRAGRDAKYSQVVQDQIRGGLAIGVNVLAYATNRGQLQTKELAFDARRDEKGAESIDRGAIRIANLRHPGGCNSAPRALVSLTEAAATALKARFKAESNDLPITDPALFEHHLVFMHGRNAFRLTEAERKQLRTFVERGGTVFADAICASTAFSESFRREMQAIFPDAPLKTIPAGDPLFTPTFGGFDLSSVTRKDPQERTGNQPLAALERKGPPELEGIKVADRYAVIFSPYDLSCALEKQDTIECRGYVRQDAARIAINVLLYSLHPQ